LPLVDGDLLDLRDKPGRFTALGIDAKEILGLNGPRIDTCRA
jgi:hypothetical protein